MKHLLIKRLKEVEKMLRTNAKADWSENDPNEEFKALADIVKGYAPTQRDHMVNELSQLICDDDPSKKLDELEAQSEIDGSVAAWDIVSIWQPFENDGWTVDDLLGKL